MHSKKQPVAVHKPIPNRPRVNPVDRFGKHPDILWDTIAVLILTAIVVAGLLALSAAVWVVS